MDETYLKIAEEVTGLSREECLGHFCKLPEIDAFYFWNPSRGGLSVIIDSEYRKLAATSAVTLEEHIEEFKSRYPDLELE